VIKLEKVVSLGKFDGIVVATQTTAKKAHDTIQNIVEITQNVIDFFMK
jgi:hypothetical protein